jgi:hypothetical protein
LESKHAVYPRILVSDRIIEQLEGLSDTDRDFLLQDVDGRQHLNYFSAMLGHSCNGPIDEEQGKRWKSAHLATIDAAIGANDGAVADKWIWFKEHFDAATAHINL